jgi:hypothetical protein
VRIEQRESTRKCVQLAIDRAADVGAPPNFVSAMAAAEDPQLGKLCGARFEQNLAADDAIGSHACWFQADNMRVANCMPLGRSLS